MTVAAALLAATEANKSTKDAPAKCINNDMIGATAIMPAMAIKTSTENIVRGDDCGALLLHE